MTIFLGDWFHSRTTGKLSELATIQNLYIASRKNEYIGKSWSIDRRNPKNAWLYNFSAEGITGSKSIQPSTMQTKIRNFIRLGFLEDSTLLPLKWTSLGLLWSNSVKNGEGEDSNLLYKMIIANSIATRSFTHTNRDYDEYPNEDTLVVKKLIKYLRKNTVISYAKLSDLIDGDTSRVGKNTSNWINDLIQSGLFIEKIMENERVYSLNAEYEPMIQAIEDYVPMNRIRAKEIIAYPLAIGAPFREGLITIFKQYASDNLLEAINTLKNINISDKLIDERILDRTIAIQRGRNSGWANDIKSLYDYKCAIPGCDAEGSIFIEAAHIMPHRVNDILRPNSKEDLNNGVALCMSCHKMYDAGLFTFDLTGKIIISNFIYSYEAVQNVEQENVQRILISSNKKLNMGHGRNQFDGHYTNYHKEHIFLGE